MTGNPRHKTQHSKLDEILRHLSRMEAQLMALDKSVADAIAAQADAIKTLATDLGQFELDAQEKQIELQHTIDALKAGDAVTAAQLKALQDAADAMDSQVVAKIAPLTDAVNKMDDSLRPVVPPAP